MTRTTKIKASLALLCVIVTAWFAAPLIVREVIEAKHPSIRVPSVRFTLKGIVLEGAVIDRPGIHAHLKHVLVGLTDGAVTVTGGDVAVDIDAVRQSPGAPGEKRVIAGKLDKIAFKMSAYQVEGEAIGASFDDTRVEFETLSASHPLGNIEASKGYVTRDKNLVSAEKVTLLPMRTPNLPGVVLSGALTPIQLENVEVHPRIPSAHIGQARYGLIYVAEQILVQLEGRKASVAVESATANLPVVFDTPVTFSKISTTINMDDFSELTAKVEGARVTVRPQDYALTGDEDCQTWLDAMPEQMRSGPLSNLRYDGKLSVSLQGKPVPKVVIKSTCKAQCESFKPLKSSFEYGAYDSTGHTFFRTAGPRTRDWVPVGLVNSTVPTAVITLEDPAFLSHKGVISQAIENSLKENLLADRFVRGGSTLTMQLAKNLWLRRNKTLGRKAQEILLALAMESCMSKDEILELYLNVVEFGPDLYGIGPAARHYFKKSPMELDEVEAFYLASILPRPRKALPPTPDVLAGVERLIAKLAKNGNPAEDSPQAGPADETGWETTP